MYMFTTCGALGIRAGAGRGRGDGETTRGGGEGSVTLGRRAARLVDEPLVRLESLHVDALHLDPARGPMTLYCTVAER